MACRFSIVRYVPDVVADERVNIGVVAVDDAVGLAKCQFVTDWNRASKLALRDASHLRQVAIAFYGACGLLTGSAESPIRLLEGGLDAISTEWRNVVQVSEPRPVMMDIDSALPFLAKRYLHQARRRVPLVTRTKKQAISKATRALKTALDDVDLDSHRVVLHNDAIVQTGRGFQHFDFGVKNGQLKIAGFGMSLESGQDDEIETRIRSIGFVALDVKRVSPDMPIGVVALGDRRHRRELWQQIDDNLGDLGIDLLQEGQVDEWAEDKVGALAGDH